jgi:uncharacterized protein YggE
VRVVRCRLGEITNAVGCATSVSGVRFDLKDREGAEAEALRLAVRDAPPRRWGPGRRRPSRAGVADHEQRGEVVRPMAMPMARGGMEMAAPAVPVESGQIEVRSHVTLTVRIE